MSNDIRKVKKGFAYERSGYIIAGRPTIYATPEAAEQAANELPAPTAPAARIEPKAAPVVVDRQALRVGGMVAELGITAPAPKANGRCHYCGQRLDRRGRCEECI